MAKQTHRYRPCTCHKLDSKDWPWAKAKIAVTYCMKRCPYCGDWFKNGEELLVHLQTDDEYRARKLEATIKKASSDIDEATAKPEIALSPEPSIHSLSELQSPCLSVVDEDLPSERQSQSPHPSNDDSDDSVDCKSLDSILGSTIDVEILLEQLSDFAAKTQALVKSIPLSTFDTMSAETQALWAESTSTWPRLFPSEECFNSKPPTSTELLLSTLNVITSISLPSSSSRRGGKSSKSDNKKVQPPSIPWHAYRRGEIDDTVNPRIAVTQLYEPDQKNPVALIGLEVPALEKKTLTTPLALSEFVEPFEETNQQLLLTPKFCFTDLHIDSSSGLSLPLHLTRKLWLLFPPTAHNLHLFSLSEGRKAKLTRIGTQLEGGVICTTSSAEAIYLPVGCIHTVFTLHGGFLVAIDFNTPDSCSTFARLFKEGLDVLVGEGFTWECRERYIAALDLALEVGNNLVREGMRSWVELGERATEWVEEEDVSGLNKAAVEKMRVIWRRFFEGKAWKMMKEGCPCGKMRAKEGFRAHFQREHLFGLLDGPSAAEEVLEEQPAKKSNKRKAEAEKSMPRNRTKIAK